MRESFEKKKTFNYAEVSQLTTIVQESAAVHPIIYLTVHNAANTTLLE
jgi:hypothetical protein